MIDYKEMYFKLFAESAKAIEILQQGNVEGNVQGNVEVARAMFVLQQAHIDCEEMYLSQE